MNSRVCNQMQLEPGCMTYAQALYYFLLSKPNPFWNIWDFFLGAPLTDGRNSNWKSSDFQLREKLGGGNFGITFEGLRLTVREGCCGCRAHTCAVPRHPRKLASIPP